MPGGNKYQINLVITQWPGGRGEGAVQRRTPKNFNPHPISDPKEQFSIPYLRQTAEINMLFETKRLR